MEQSPFIRAVNECNLCTWYILPLIGLNKFSFNEANFINSYLTRDGQYIAVEVTDRNLCAGVMQNSHFTGHRKSGSRELLTFVIPGDWATDVQRFMAGKYSQMSEYAKQLIREYSGLTYMVYDPEVGTERTDARLLALYTDKSSKQSLIHAWLTELSVETPVKSYELIAEDIEDMELLSIPSEDSYIGCDLLFNRPEI